VCTGCWWGSLRERGHGEDQDVDGSSGSWRGSWGQVAGTCGYGEGLLGSINVGNF
jgi:hypothetical protein